MYLIYLLALFVIPAFCQDEECTGAVGDVKWSVLDPAKFQEVNGNCWTIMDGKTLPGDSKLKAMGFNAVPNGQGVFLRAIDLRSSGRKDTDRPRGTVPGNYQEDKLKSHMHAYNDIYLSLDQNFYNQNDGLPNTTFIGTGRNRGLSSSDRNNSFWQTERETETSGSSEETRPKNIALYLYIRIN